MSDKDFAKLMEIAKESIEAAKTMTKTEAIASLYRSGIVTKKGEFNRHYKKLKDFSKEKKNSTIN
ncbi:hypothetical protein LV84_04142 [Algoriphagus ratkowskyi]|uniref:Uncharacterized protein n=1 Tax=Algoriphagus ratkowskyi TaxID=57028 RepID=A0A2W7SGU3_9BACT|nr:hypothetical protein [Algoriphagus ratkowskyi]PZX49952.1 hypothetical protein LV84_04142 [Algoriphagus ratkowskyi]TXD75523.1 hypothetical protein ESW18_20135 [Algoriphagus ratkowskyi]